MRRLAKAAIVASMAIACERHSIPPPPKVEDKRETKCLEEVQVRISVCKKECTEKIKHVEGLYLHGHGADEQNQAKRDMIARANQHMSELREAFRNSPDCDGTIRIQTKLVEPRTEKIIATEEIKSGSFCRK